jgi:eukaryotic-like serine/threonine-protein kinase
VTESSKVGTSHESDADEADEFLREVAHVEDVPVPAPELQVGQSLGRFRIISELGRGGMGIVYLAHDASLQRSVALKLLRPGLTRKDERYRRFLREARAAASVTHPNLTTIYDVGEVEGQLYIAMERLDGTSLRDVVTRSPLALGEATRLALQILAGVEQAHRAGFVHRDLKPENVIVTTSGVAKLLDFGLAKQHRVPGGLDGDAAGDAPAEPETVEGQLLGTPGYMSPEQVRGTAIDPRSDIFSFGVLLFEMLAGVRPFVGRSTADLQSAILRDAPLRLAERRADVPPALERVVERCLQKDPALRYESCGALAEALARCAEPESMALPAEGPSAPSLAPTQPARPRARRRLGLVIAGATLALAAALLVLRRGEPPAGSAEVTPTSGEASAQATPPELTPLPVTSLPLPTSRNPEALAAYSAALQGTRDGNWGYVTMLLQRAVSLDPTLAIAHLRLAIYQYGSPLADQGRASFGRALLARDSFSERDQAMLAALEPLYRDPPDRGEVIARLQALTQRYPNDAEFFSLLSLWSLDAHAALAAAQRSVELDPQFADGWQFMGARLSELGDTAAALRALDHCVALSPAASDCHAERGFIYRAEGRCVDMEADFRAAHASSRSLLWQDGRAAALFALGRPPEASLEVYANKWSRLPDAVRAVTELIDRSDLNLALGEFAEAERQSLAARRLMASGVDAQMQGRIALQLVRLYTETSRLKEAGSVADDYLKRKAGWVGSAVDEDPSVAMYWALLRANLLSRASFVEKRDAWLRDIAPATRGKLRSRALAQYVTGVETEAEAREALSLFPDLEPPALEASRFETAQIGFLYLRTARPLVALPYLEKAARSCAALSAPIEYVRASDYLGQAEEATGDIKAACAAYGNVLARWGHATLPSRTARHARARSIALGCKQPPRKTALTSR